MSNVIEASPRETTVYITDPRYQYDYGQVLKFVDIDLPDTYEVHFANGENATTVRVWGDQNGVQIPDIFFITGDDIWVWLYVHEGESDGRTVARARIPILARPLAVSTDITMIDQDTLTRLLAAISSVDNNITSISDSFIDSLD